MTHDDNVAMLRSAKQLMDQFDAMERKQLNGKLRIVSLRAELDDLNSRLGVLRNIEPVHTSTMDEIYIRIGSIGIELRRLGA